MGNSKGKNRTSSLYACVGVRVGVEREIPDRSRTGRRTFKPRSERQRYRAGYTEERQKDATRNRFRASRRIAEHALSRWRRCRKVSMGWPAPSLPLPKLTSLSSEGKKKLSAHKQCAQERFTHVLAVHDWEVGRGQRERESYAQGMCVYEAHASCVLLAFPSLLTNTHTHQERGAGDGRGSNAQANNAKKNKSEREREKHRKRCTNRAKRTGMSGVKGSDLSSTNTRTTPVRRRTATSMGRDEASTREDGVADKRKEQQTRNLIGNEGNSEGQRAATPRSK